MSALKFIWAALAAVAAAVVPVLAVAPLDTVGLFNVVALAAGALTVYIGQNTPDGTWKYAKTILSAVAALAVVLQSTGSGGVTVSELIQIGAAVAGTLGVFGLKNKGDYGQAG